MTIFFTPTRSPIGLDIGSRWTKAAQLSRRRDTWRVEATLAVPRSRPGQSLDAAEAARLAELFYRQGFKGNRLVIAAPSALLRTELLELPPRNSGAPIRQLACQEMARITKLPAGTFEVAQWELPATAKPSGGSGGAGAANSFAVALPNGDADALLDPLEQAGFVVAAIDTQAGALHRSVGGAQPSALSALIDLGWAVALLAMSLDQTIVYQRHLAALGAHSIVAAVAQRLGTELGLAEDLLIPPANGNEGDGLEIHPHLQEAVRSIVEQHTDAIATELNASCAYVTQRYPNSPIQTMHVSGGGALLPGLLPRLGERTGMTCKTVGPEWGAGAALQAPDHCPAALLALAYGLARYEDL